MINHILKDQEEIGEEAAAQMMTTEELDLGDKQIVTHSCCIEVKIPIIASTSNHKGDHDYNESGTNYRRSISDDRNCHQYDYSSDTYDGMSNKLLEEFNRFLKTKQLKEQKTLN